VTPSPHPRCFLEVLILKGFQQQFSEVLILEDLLSPVLILIDFKSFIISDLIKNEVFMEVLILEGLGRAAGMAGWSREGEKSGNLCGREAEFSRRRRAGMVVRNSWDRAACIVTECKDISMS
jgi:hypothetical protein